MQQQEVQPSSGYYPEEQVLPPVVSPSLLQQQVKRNQRIQEWKMTLFAIFEVLITFWVLLMVFFIRSYTLLDIMDMPAQRMSPSPLLLGLLWWFSFVVALALLTWAVLRSIRFYRYRKQVQSQLRGTLILMIIFRFLQILIVGAFFYQLFFVW